MGGDCYLGGPGHRFPRTKRTKSTRALTRGFAFGRFRAHRQTTVATRNTHRFVAAVSYDTAPRTFKVKPRI
ncbi:conserved hypothetical protein [Thiomonas arsenitoxydans]|uniref:Uncharacterized protein n=1 Tax=Thiomonas arsenitoxydans (strain DSM 22701 / CIP 110005 / 3As) TaxID=426114 RepID=D6CSC3_THIA3|nr:Hypothetical protein THI_0949 [Thiomonas arsenitoxydans]CQR26899.1 conserved hypothetical protein [Thiomonas arsenitoxydans]CQR30316.1 conserved hypothetical protein [Thiomonas arsenitoxydans]CQR30353.1 conserved hypothetical protein [Thiomonas arsenitoxydans]CQR32259.1 conserved hypothetical protein [Thiomonas arsenitoxydans]